MSAWATFKTYSKRIKEMCEEKWSLGSGKPRDLYIALPVEFEQWNIKTDG